MTDETETDDASNPIAMSLGAQIDDLADQLRETQRALVEMTERAASFEAQLVGERAANTEMLRRVNAEAHNNGVIKSMRTYIAALEENTGRVVDNPELVAENARLHKKLELLRDVLDNDDPDEE